MKEVRGQNQRGGLITNSILLFIGSGPCFSQGNTQQATDGFIQLIALATSPWPRELGTISDLFCYY